MLQQSKNFRRLYIKNIVKLIYYKLEMIIMYKSYIFIVYTKNLYIKQFVIANKTLTYKKTRTKKLTRNCNCFFLQNILLCKRLI